MARDVQARFYDKASRYTTSAFMRLKLGDALQRREMAPHVFEIGGREPARTRPAAGDAAARAAIWACPWAASIGWPTGSGGREEAERTLVCVHGLTRQGARLRRPGAGLRPPRAGG